MDKEKETITLDNIFGWKPSRRKFIILGIAAALTPSFTELACTKPVDTTIPIYSTEDVDQANAQADKIMAQEETLTKDFLRPLLIQQYGMDIAHYDNSMINVLIDARKKGLGTEGYYITSIIKSNEGWFLSILNNFDKDEKLTKTTLNFSHDITTNKYTLLSTFTEPDENGTRRISHNKVISVANFLFNLPQIKWSGSGYQTKSDFNTAEGWAAHITFEAYGQPEWDGLPQLEINYNQIQ